MAIPGICYVHLDGEDVPVIDITHPLFALDEDADAKPGVVEAYLAEQQRFACVPMFIARPLLWLVLRRSRLLGGIHRQKFLGGLATYRMKLGPEALGSGWSDVDLRIAASLPVLSMRLRLRDMARLLADRLAGPLAADRRPLTLVNIAGGPAPDSLNALILLRKERPELLDRPIRIRVLDLDAEGPAFAGKALAALKAAGAPLEGLDVALDHVPYDWTRVEGLRAVLAEAAGTLVAASSEGGLFEYGADEAITANLEALFAGTGPDAVVVGSVTRGDGPGRFARRTSRVPVRPRSLAEFQALTSGWSVAKVIERPMSRNLVLVKEAK
jgi:hypothetical protein